MTVTDYYNEVNKKMSVLINKTIMTYGKDNVKTLFSLNTPYFSAALAKVQELESNNFRVQTKPGSKVKLEYLTVNQPANKVTRLYNINEDHFLDQTPTGECLI